eukprot:3154605-Rhodomonas_salina.2
MGGTDLGRCAMRSSLGCGRWGYDAPDALGAAAREAERAHTTRAREDDPGTEPCLSDTRSWYQSAAYLIRDPYPYARTKECDQQPGSPPQCAAKGDVLRLDLPRGARPDQLRSSYKLYAHGSGRRLIPQRLDQLHSSYKVYANSGGVHLIPQPPKAVHGVPGRRLPGTDVGVGWFQLHHIQY